MAVLFLLVGATAFGIFAILLVSASAPKPLPAPGPETPLSALDAFALGRLVTRLLENLGLEVESSTGGPAHLEIRALNPAPVTGGQVLVHCVTTAGGAAIGRSTVQDLVQATRAGRVTKGLLFTTGSFSPEAVLEAEDQAVELFDGARTARLAEEALLAPGERLVDLIAELSRFGGVRQ